MIHPKSPPAMAFSEFFSDMRSNAITRLITAISLLYEVDASIYRQTGSLGLDYESSLFRSTLECLRTESNPYPSMVIDEPMADAGMGTRRCSSGPDHPSSYITLGPRITTFQG